VTAPGASLDAILTAPTVVVPGLHHWLGIPQPDADEPDDAYEAYLNRISQEAPHA
jgi:hypothetical protein